MKSYLVSIIHLVCLHIPCVCECVCVCVCIKLMTMKQMLFHTSLHLHMFQKSWFSQYFVDFVDVIKRMNFVATTMTITPNYTNLCISMLRIWLIAVDNNEMECVWMVAIQITPVRIDRIDTTKSDVSNERIFCDWASWNVASVSLTNFFSYVDDQFSKKTKKIWTYASAAHLDHRGFNATFWFNFSQMP